MPSTITYLTSYYSPVPGSCPVSDPYCNPILTIASLRNYTDAPVVVYDFNGCDWKSYPKMLDFQVVPAVMYNFHHSLPPLTRLVFSRIITLFRSAALHPGKYVHMDTDLFWMGCVPEDWDFSVLRMARTGCFVNNGCFTFDGGYRSFSMLSQVAAACLMADRPGMEETVKRVTTLDYYNDESMICYLLHMGDLGIPLEPFSHNGMIHSDVRGQTNLHLLQGCMPQPIRANRVLYALMMEEINHGVVRDVFPGFEPQIAFSYAQCQTPEFRAVFTRQMDKHMIGGRLDV
jgi:hypothetical protein